MVARRSRTLVVTVGLALLAAACGQTSSGNEAATGAASETSSSATSSPSASESGGATEAKTASGEPIVIGMINQEDTPAGSFPEQREAEEAAVKYVNNELGGVGGRPLKLIVETTQGTPESSAAAANKLLEQDPMVVTPGTDFGTSATIPIFEKANMPYIGGVPLLPPEYTSKVAFFFVGGSVAAFPGQAVYLGKEVGAKKVNIIYTDNPAGKAAATSFGQAILEQFGVTDVKLLPEAANATDFTPVVSAANDDKPDAIMVLFAAQGCSRIMQAVASLGITTPMYYPGSCFDADVIEAGGAGAEGAFFNSENILYSDTSNEDVATYRKAMEKYAPDAKISGYSQSSFATIMNLKAIFEEIGVDNLSHQAIIDYMNQTQDHESFMEHPYTCKGDHIAGLTAVCNSAVRMVQYKGGEFTDVLGDWVDGGPEVGGGGGGSEQPSASSS